MARRARLTAPRAASGGRPRPLAAEFFAGIGLVRAGLEQAGIDVVWANDIEPSKKSVYAANFDGADYRLADIRGVRGADLPDIDVATASFPCVDLSLAGNRQGLAGEQSGLFFEFCRVLREMGPRAPSAVMVENVMSFVSSRQGADLHNAIAELNGLGYVCDIIAADAKWFLPQSRPRLFLIGARNRMAGEPPDRPGPLRPEPVSAFTRRHRGLNMQAIPMPAPPSAAGSSFSDLAERMGPEDSRWWDGERLERFWACVAPGHLHRMGGMRLNGAAEWRTAYRRTRRGSAVWEIRPDGIAGCLRTARGGSSRQAVVEIGPAETRARWMTPLEYAKLQGAPESFDVSSVTESQAMTGFGDAVCVPVIAWLSAHAIIPAVSAAAGKSD